jgi:hypothetical protein
MLVVVRLVLVARVLVVVRSMLAGMLMHMARALVMPMRVLVLVLVVMAVGVFVRVRMLALARVRVRVFVLVGMLVRMVVGMLVVALHGRLLFPFGSSGIGHNIMPRMAQVQPARIIPSCASFRLFLLPVCVADVTCRVP